MKNVLTVCGILSLLLIPAFSSAQVYLYPTSMDTSLEYMQLNGAINALNDTTMYNQLMGPNSVPAQRLQQFQQQTQQQELLNALQQQQQQYLQQQKQLSQQQLYQQKAMTCPLNSQPYVSKTTGQIGNCVCIPPYSMQNGVCVIPNQSQSVTSPTPHVVNNGCPSGFVYVAAKATCVMPDASCRYSYGVNSYAQSFDPTTGNPTCGCTSGYQWNATKTQCVATTVQSVQGSSGGGGGGSTGLVSCDEMVMGQMTHFGTMTTDQCNATWQAAVVSAQKKSAPVATAPAKPTPTPKFYLDTHPETMTATASVATTTTAPRRNFWSWFISLFGLANS